MDEKPVLLPYLFHLDEYKPAPHGKRHAHFSTDFGRRPARSAFENMPIQIRSDYIEARCEMIQSLRSQFPDACKALTTPDVNPRDSPLNFFDEFDLTFYQPQFLYEVLSLIVHENHEEEKARESEVMAFAESWIKINQEAYNLFDDCHQPKDLFVQEDFEEFGPAFLEACFWRIAHIKEKAETSQNLPPSSRIGHTSHSTDLGGSQHANRIPRPHSVQSAMPPQQPVQSAESRGPSHVPILPISTSTHHPQHVPHSARSLPSARAQQPVPRPNAEQRHLGHELYAPHIVPRQLPVIYTAENPRQSRHYTPVGRDTPRTTNPAGSVEHFKGTRKDYHSDPTPTAWSPQVGLTENFITKYAQGKPGPFAYQRVPTSARERGFPAHSSQIDRGVRNPWKATSDDARADVEATMNQQWVPYLPRPLTEERPPREYAPIVDRRPSRTSSFGPGGFQLDHLNRDRANFRDAEQRRRNALPGGLNGAIELNVPRLKPRFVSNPFESNQSGPPMRYSPAALNPDEYRPARQLYDPIARIPLPRETHDPRFANTQPAFQPSWASNDRMPLAQMPNSSPRHPSVARDWGCQVWLGGLPEWASPVELNQFFEGHQGFVDVSAVRQKEDYRFGWATFRDRAQRDSALKSRDEFKKRFGETARMEPAQPSRPYHHRQHQMQNSDTTERGQENSGPKHNERLPVEPKTKQSPTKEQHRSNKLGDGADDPRKDFTAKHPKESPEPSRKIKPVQTPLSENEAGLVSAEGKQPATRKPSGQHRKKQSASGKPLDKTGSSAKAEPSSIPEHDGVPTSEDFPPLLSPKKAPSVSQPTLDGNAENREKKPKDSLSQDSGRAQIKDTNKQGESPIGSHTACVLPESDTTFPHKQGANAESFAQVTARQVKGSNDQESEPTTSKACQPETGVAEVKRSEAKTSEAKTPEIQSPTKAPKLKYPEVESLEVQVAEGKPHISNKQEEDWKIAQSRRNLKRLQISTDKQGSCLPLINATQEQDAEAIGESATKPSEATQEENIISVGPPPLSSPTIHPPNSYIALSSPPSEDNIAEDQKPVPTSASLQEKREQDIGHSRARSEPWSAAKHKEIRNKPENPSDTRGDEPVFAKVDHDGVVESDLTSNKHDIPHKSGELTPQEERPAVSHTQDNEVTLPMEPISTHKKKLSKPSTPTRRNFSESSKNAKSQEQPAKQASPPKIEQFAKAEYPKATSNLVTELIVPTPQASNTGGRKEQHSSSTPIEKQGGMNKPPIVDTCGGQYRIIAGLPTPTMGQRLAELGENVWQEIVRDPSAKEDRGSKDKMKEQPTTPSINKSDSHVESAPVGEVLPDSKLYPLQERFFKANTILKCVTYEFRHQPQVTCQTAKLLSSSPPGLDQGVMNLCVWMVGWVSEAESLIATLPQSKVYDEFLKQELRCTLPSIKLALNHLSQEYTATQDSQADFGNFARRLHKVGGEAKDFQKKPIPIEHGNDLASVDDIDTQLAWHATALRLMDLWKSGREGYKDIMLQKLSVDFKTRGLEAAERVYTQSMADFFRRPVFGATTRPEDVKKLPSKLSEKTKEFLRQRYAKSRQGATVGDITRVTGNTTGVTGNTTGVTGNTTGVTGNTTGVTGNTTKEDSQEEKTGANSKAKNKKKNRKKKKSKAKNAAITADSPEPAADAEGTEAGQDPESGLLESGYLSKGQKKDGLEEHEWIYETIKRELGKHAFEQPGETLRVFDFVPKDGPWGAIDKDTAKAQIKSHVLEQTKQQLDDTQEIYRVESNSPPRYAWRQTREFGEGMSVQEMADYVFLQAMQTQFQHEVQEMMDKRLVEHAEMHEAASALANLKFTPTSSQDSNATIPDFESVDVENHNMSNQNDSKENVATIKEKDMAINEDDVKGNDATIKEKDSALKENDAAIKGNNTTLGESIATTKEVNTATEESNAIKDSTNNPETNIIIKENNTTLRGGDAQAGASAARKKPANGKGSDSWSVPTGEPVWGGSGSGAGHNSNKRKAPGGQKRKLGK